MRRASFLLLSAFAALFASAPRAQAADAASSPAPSISAAAPASEHPWLAALSALLVDRYHAAGELRLAWQRPPASAPADAELEIVNAPAVLAPQILVLVRAREASGRVSEHSLLLRAELFRDAWLLRQPAAIGSALVPAALESARVDALRERDALVLDAADAAELELDFARAVPAGRILVWRDVVRRPLVRRGQPFDVVATDGSLTVSLRAVALHDAARGDSVRVRNPDSKKEFVAIVVAESRASVRF